MSASVLGLVFAHYPHGGGELVLALALADCAHDDGSHVRPGIAALAAKSRQSRNTVIRQLKGMVDRGWLQVVASPHGRGEDSFVEYRIDPLWLNQCRRGDCPSTEDATDLRYQNGASSNPSDGLRSQIEAPKRYLNRKNSGEKPGLRSHFDTSTGVSGGGKGGVFTAVLNNKEILVGDSVVTPDLLTAKDDELARWMLARIREHVNPKHSEPRNWARWTEAIRLMRTRDKRTHREIAELFGWANRDSFWAANILSPTALREQWDKLTAKRLATLGKAPAAVKAADRRCVCGCGAAGVKSFRTDGTEWWSLKCYDLEAMRREIGGV